MVARPDASSASRGRGAPCLGTPGGTVASEPLGGGPGGSGADGGAEASRAVAPGQHVAAGGCDFVRDEVFILREHTPIGITRVDKTGSQTGSFTNTNLPSLNGIAFDTTGAFDHRLLVTGAVNGKTEVVAIDCTRAVHVVTNSAPVLEGGLAVVPPSFGHFARDLMAPDEL